MHRLPVGETIRRCATSRVKLAAAFDEIKIPIFTSGPNQRSENIRISGTGGQRIYEKLRTRKGNTFASRNGKKENAENGLPRAVIYRQITSPLVALAIPAWRFIEERSGAKLCWTCAVEVQTREKQPPAFPLILTDHDTPPPPPPPASPPFPR